ncbi:MAG TPA: bifunctional glycosyltransferase/class I SAM-dependent methyltransferase [Leptolinea sp.]
MSKKRVLVFVVSFRAEKFISSVLARIPESIKTNPNFDVEVLVIDDESGDRTFQRAQEFASHVEGLKVTVLHNPKNQGYGGNQKIGYHYAINQNFDAVILLHGDGQYPPEYIGQLVQPLLDDQAEAVFGSRMLNKRAALQGGMPFYKWIGNQILTSLQNQILGVHLAEFHTGYRAYRVDALRSIPFEVNSNYFDFDTDIIIQLLDTHKRILEIPIPTFYGGEVSRVAGFKYGAMIIRTSIISRLMRLGIFYNPRFDYLAENAQYVPKFGYDSSHQFAIDRIPAGSTVLDLGGGPGVMAAELTRKQVQTISVDKNITSPIKEYSSQTIQADLDVFDFNTAPEDVDIVIMLDIIEHLRNPEAILKKIRQRYSGKGSQIILTTGNVAFLPIRFGLLLGQFNYGRRGILDLDHTRLFTFYALRRVLVQAGYEVLEERGIPAPFYLALGKRPLADFLMGINRLLIRISRSLFSYQIGVVAKATPTLEVLLDRAVRSGQEKAAEIMPVSPNL